MDHQDYFRYYASRKLLLGKLSLHIEEGKNPTDMFLLKRSAYTDSTSAELDIRILVNKLVDDVEEQLLSILLQSDRTSVLDINPFELDKYDYAVTFNLSYFNSAIHKKALGLELKSYLDNTRQLLSANERLSILLPATNIGALNLYMGESPLGEPGVWRRQIENTIQVGVGFKFNDLANYMLVKP